MRSCLNQITKAIVIISDEQDGVEQFFKYNHTYFLLVYLLYRSMSDKEDKTTFDVTFRGMNRALLGRRYIN